MIATIAVSCDRCGRAQLSVDRNNNKRTTKGRVKIEFTNYQKDYRGITNQAEKSVFIRLTYISWKLQISFLCRIQFRPRKEISHLHCVLTEAILKIGTQSLKA